MPHLPPSIRTIPLSGADTLAQTVSDAMRLTRLLVNNARELTECDP
jgi:hypothetical protein